MAKEMSEAARQRKRLLASVCRQGANAIVTDTIPDCWVHYFSYDDLEAFSDREGDKVWDREHATEWLSRWEAQGYHFSGPGLGETESGTCNGLFGTLQKVFLVNQKVLDEDESNARFSISGSDELPSEYVMDKLDHAVVVLPDNFEPRLDDRSRDVDEPRGAETPAPAARPEDVGTGARADEEALREAADPENWTNEACDFAVLYLATRGWEVGPALPGTERDDWFAGHWGPTMYYLARQVLPGSPADNHVIGKNWAIKPTLITANGSCQP